MITETTTVISEPSESVEAVDLANLYGKLALARIVAGQKGMVHDLIHNLDSVGTKRAALHVRSTTPPPPKKGMLYAGGNTDI